MALLDCSVSSPVIIDLSRHQFPLHAYSGTLRESGMRAMVHAS
ncbi:unnamed protein product [Chondrus crispus]|uniref:Uncharacterized protein n=1 Tax=Chondrus crispus TaxID=2769 RepID=R7QDC4_CHOCR|nr:unnamed protein product [Chondrus crispus]CDF36069.1 unnamed protein product [Chondrus crispus]|eukprot:XP_005715888.1 unnamed protein product [Chondrus crispus]